MSLWEGAITSVSTETEFFNAAQRTAFLLVEGGSDERFWWSRVDLRRCQVRAVGSREKVMSEIQVAQREGRAGFLAILDADFDRIENVIKEYQDIIWTDSHDLEMMLIASAALDKTLTEVASHQKRATCETIEGKTLRESLLDKGTMVGQLRFLSKKEQMNLCFRKLKPDGSFKHIDYHDFCNKRTWSMDLDLLIKTVLNFSSRHDLRKDEILVKISNLPNSFDPLQMCIGHDIIGILAIGLRSKIGGRNLSIEDIQERLRLAFERNDLEKTTVYRLIRDWEIKNKEYKILRW